MQNNCRHLIILLPRCIDKLEEKVKKEKSDKDALETARTAVLSCPMCGQRLNTEQVQLMLLLFIPPNCEDI